MKQKNLILAVAFFALVSAGVTLFISSKRGSMGEFSMMRGEESVMMAKDSIVRNSMGGGESGIAISEPMDVASKMMAPQVYPMPPYYGDGDALQMVDRSYQKYAEHRVVVDDVSTYMRTTKEYILSVGGRVLTSSVSTDAQFDSGYINAKVPVAKFEEATGRVTEGVEKIVGETINAQDVTGTVVGTANQITSLKDQKQLKEAELADAKKSNLSTSAQIRIQQQIDQLQRQIEQAEKQAAAVTEGVEYASLNIQVADAERYFLGGNYEPSVWEEFTQAVKSLGGSAKVLAKLFVWVLVYAVIWLPILWTFRAIMARFPRRAA